MNIDSSCDHKFTRSSSLKFFVPRSLCLSNFLNVLQQSKKNWKKKHQVLDFFFLSNNRSKIWKHFHWVCFALFFAKYIRFWEKMILKHFDPPQTISSFAPNSLLAQILKFSKFERTTSARSNSTNEGFLWRWDGLKTQKNIVGFVKNHFQAQNLSQKMYVGSQNWLFTEFSNFPKNNF